MHRCFWSESSNKRKTTILAVLRFKVPFERDAFRLNLFGTFRETTLKQVRNSSLGTFMRGNDTTSILQLRKHAQFFCPALKMISNANSAAVQNKVIFLLTCENFKFLFRWTRPDDRWSLLA